MENLIVDKTNGLVSYNDELHKYWVTGSNQFCTSVTTLINKFTTFDQEFWSKYKALERIVPEDKFKKMKTSLLRNKKITQEILDEYKVNSEELNSVTEVVLDEWKEKGKTATDRGTKIHKDYEMSILSRQYDLVKGFGDFINRDAQLIDNNIIKAGNYVLPELLISRVSDDGYLRIAGQADLVIVEGNKFKVLDFKTNKEIKQKSYYDNRRKKYETMKYPLTHLHDTNFWHYTLQLSIYAWMIEKNNPDLKLDGLFILHHDHDDVKTVYECEYLKTDVENLLKFYKKDVMYQEFLQRNKP